MAHISEEDILYIIKSLPNKGTGPASIPLQLLKLIAHIVVVPLCYIINCSFSTGVFPDVLKVAIVIARHKGGLSDNLNNYRPISLLSIFDKIIAFYRTDQRALTEPKFSTKKSLIFCCSANRSY